MVGVIARQRLTELLQGPLVRRVSRYPAVEDLAAAQFHHDQYIKDTETSRDHGEEIGGKRSPGRGYE